MHLISKIKKKLYRAGMITHLLPAILLRSRFSIKPVCDGVGPIVSLTTHGARVNRVHLTIESIARGRIRPGRIILWIDDDRIIGNLPQQLRRLQSRGLEIRKCDNFGPHTKYYPLVMSGSIDRPFVTADDDILYPSWWLETLVRLGEHQPDSIVCYRARLMTESGNGTLAPYKTWPLCDAMDTCPMVFLNGVSGVLYPRSFCELLSGTHTEFSQKCPKADDIWLNYIAIIHGIPVRQAFNTALHFPMIPFSQGAGLKNYNVDLDGNDPQIAAVYDSTVINKIFKTH